MSNKGSSVIKNVEKESNMGSKKTNFLSGRARLANQIREQQGLGNNHQFGKEQQGLITKIWSNRGSGNIKRNEQQGLI